MRLFITSIIVFMVLPGLKADEGMWLPYLLSDKQIEQMQNKGLQVPFESIYSHSAPSLKDAVVSLDDGACTGEFISSKGLLLTNHHCGYNEIQAHSSVEHNYLDDGFWATSLAHELPNPGKTATILVEAHDVTQKVLAELDSLKGMQRQLATDSIIDLIEREVNVNASLQAEVKPFFYGNTYILFITQTFRDVRLVGTPPSSIGKFGGDTDNWMWPATPATLVFLEFTVLPMVRRLITRRKTFLIRPKSISR